jgi:CxxC-x17-CxxC domain-containing protein
MDFLPEGVSFNKNITYLAKTNFRGQEQVFGIKRRDRRQHMYVLGKSGSGKSVLLGNMIVQNIWNGEGVCVVDPHGELVEGILASIPAHRVKDVVYFNPADTDYHIGFNVLEVDDPKYKHLVASGLMGIFTKIWANAWSARMEYILNNAILALGDTEGSTLLGIPRLLVDKDYRQMVVNNLKDPVIKAFWVHEYETWRDQYRNEAIAPIQNKVGQFLSTAMVRNVLGQPKSTINLFEMMNTGKIFLVNVSKGRIGEDNSALLGGMLITKLQLAAMERVRVPEEERKDFYLYVDEFQNFVTDSFASILSEARKYRLCLTLAHQYIAQLVTKDSEAVRDAVFGNVGTMIVFRVGAADADFLEKEFEPEFMVQDMVNLPNYTIYLKLMVDGVTSRPFSAKTLPPYKIPVDQNVSEVIIESSRRLYARPREEVEAEINSWSGMHGGGNDSGEGKFKAVCSSCGKETTVPFEPEPGRPVYCKDCIAKIKSGELKPVKGMRPSKSLEPQSFAALANLGIEFAVQSSASASPAAPRPVSAPQSSAPQTPAASSTAPRPYVKPAASPAPAAQQTRPTRPFVPPAAPKPQAPASAAQPKPASVPPPTAAPVRPVPPAPRPLVVRERKEPDHEGLQSILKEALGDALKTMPVVAPMAPKPIEEKKTISLASLKRPEPEEGASPKLASKVASGEHVSALAEAIARAGISHTAKPAISIPTPPTESKNVDPAPSIREASLADAAPVTTAFVPNRPEPPTPPAMPKTPEPKPEEPKQEIPEVTKTTASAAPKRVREVPEDILRKVLSE